MLASVEPAVDPAEETAIDWVAMRSALRPSAYRALRSVADRAAALVTLAVLLPLLLAIALAVRLDSRGPIFFRQQRVGRFGRPFTIIKFRTMQVHAPVYSLKVTEGDPRVTRAGKFLRRTGLDELPQLLNVIRGDMALIGPRPEQLGLISRYEPWQHERHLVKPGITGWWQIHHRDSEPMFLNIEKDIYYVRNQGPRLDWLIACGTVRVLVGGFVRRPRPLRLEASAAPAIALPLVEDGFLEVTASPAE